VSAFGFHTSVLVTGDVVRLLVVCGVGISLVGSAFRPVWVVRVTSVAGHRVVLLLAGEFFMLHVRAVLFEKDIVVFVFLASFLALSGSVLCGWFGAHGLDIDWDIVLSRVELLRRIRLQLEHQVALIDVGLGGAEGG